MKVSGGESITSIARIVDLCAVAIDDLRSPTMDGGPGLWERYKPTWYSSRREMYRTKGRHTGVSWPGYDMSRSGERRYVAIKSAIYRREGRKLNLRADLLRWMRGKERLYPSLTNDGSPYGVWRERERSLTVGTRLNYARRLGRTGTIPKRLGGGRHPARPLLEVKGAAALDLRRIVARYVVAHEDGLTAQFDAATVVQTRGLRR